MPRNSVFAKTLAATAVAFTTIVTGSARAANHDVIADGCSFVPAYLEIVEGDTVTWHWSPPRCFGGNAHTVTSGRSSNPADGPGAIFDAPLDNLNTTFAFTFDDPGNFPYFCRPHEFRQMRGTVAVRCANPDTACREGNVDTGSGGPPVDVLFVNGSAGAPPAREVIVNANTPVSITIEKPPAGGSGLYAFWILRREPCVGDATTALLKTSAGPQTIGTSCFCLPVNNTDTPGACPCSLVLGTGWVSKPIFGAAAAANVCLHRAPADPRAPATIVTTFPPGIYSVAGLVFDPNSAFAPKKVSLTNLVLVLARQ